VASRQGRTGSSLTADKGKRLVWWVDQSSAKEQEKGACDERAPAEGSVGKKLGLRYEKS